MCFMTLQPNNPAHITNLRAWVVQNEAVDCNQPSPRQHYQLLAEGHRIQAVDEGRLIYSDRLDGATPGAPVRVSGVWAGEPWNSELKIQRIVRGEGHQLPEALLRHLLLCPVSEAVQQLLRLIDSLSDDMRSFVVDVLSDDDIGPRFTQLPASIKHHHDYVGGLMDHSIECCVHVMRVASLKMDKSELEAVVVAALFHDIGKIKTYDLKGGYSDYSRATTHDDQNLRVLSPYLDQLDDTAFDQSLMLQAAITKRGERYSTVPGAVLVYEADRYSAANDRREQAFAQSGHHQLFAYANFQRREGYLRVRPDSGQSDNSWIEPQDFPHRVQLTG